MVRDRRQMVVECHHIKGARQRGILGRKLCGAVSEYTAYFKTVGRQRSGVSMRGASIEP